MIGDLRHCYSNCFGATCFPQGAGPAIPLWLPVTSVVTTSAPLWRARPARRAPQCRFKGETKTQGPRLNHRLIRRFKTLTSTQKTHDKPSAKHLPKVGLESLTAPVAPGAPGTPGSPVGHQLGGGAATDPLPHASRSPGCKETPVCAAQSPRVRPRPKTSQPCDRPEGKDIRV